MNNSTNHTIAVIKDLGMAVDISLYIILILSLLGNTLLITAVMRVKQLRSTVNYFVMNLAVCDILNVMSIPFSLEIRAKLKASESYPFGLIGCKIIVPFNTYVKTTGLFTLVCVAIEGFITISSISGIRNKRRTIITFVLIHALGIIIVTPNCYYLKYGEYKGNMYCYEALSASDAYIYTICLFLFQYLLPLVMIAVMYSLAWYKLQKRNKKMIKMSEEYERKMAWNANGTDSKTSADLSERPENDHDNHDSVTTAEKPLLKQAGRADSGLKRSTSRVSVMKKMLVRKSTFISETAFVRHQQTKRTLRMFITVVIVFAIFQLPNQVIWLYENSYRYPLVIDTCIILAYISPVVNCWIYGGLSKRFRGAYIEVLSEIFLCKRTGYKIGRASVATAATRVSRASSYYDSKQQQKFQERQSAFTNMFAYHDKHFDELKHLYNINTQEETAAKNTGQKPKRKMTLANFFYALKGPSQSSQSLDKESKPPKKKMSLFSKQVSARLPNDHPLNQNNLQSNEEQTNPKRKITIANIIGAAFKTPRIETKQLSLPSLLTEIDATNKAETVDPEKHIENLFIRNAVTVMAPSIPINDNINMNIENVDVHTATAISGKHISPTLERNFVSGTDMLEAGVSSCESVASFAGNTESIQKSHTKETVRYNKMKQRFKHNRNEVAKSKRGNKLYYTHENSPVIEKREYSPIVHSLKPLPKQRSNSLVMDKDTSADQSERRASTTDIGVFKSNPPNLPIYLKDSIRKEEKCRDKKCNCDFRVKPAKQASAGNELSITNKEESLPQKASVDKPAKIRRKNATFSKMPSLFHITSNNSSEVIHVATRKNIKEDVYALRNISNDKGMATQSCENPNDWSTDKDIFTESVKNPTLQQSPPVNSKHHSTFEESMFSKRESCDNINLINGMPSSYPLSYNFDTHGLSHHISGNGQSLGNGIEQPKGETEYSENAFNDENECKNNKLNEHNALLESKNADYSEGQLINSKGELKCHMLNGMQEMLETNENGIEKLEVIVIDKISNDLSSLVTNSPRIAKIENDSKEATIGHMRELDATFQRKTKLTEHVNTRLAEPIKLFDT